MRSCARASSPMAHIAFWTLAEFLRPQTFSMGSVPRCSKGRRCAPTSVEVTGFLGQHDRNAVADRIGELGRARDQFLLLRVVFERRFGQRTDQDFQQLRIDNVAGMVGRHERLLTISRLTNYVRGGWPCAPAGIITATASRRSCLWRARSRSRRPESPRGFSGP